MNTKILLCLIAISFGMVYTQNNYFGIRDTDLYQFETKESYLIATVFKDQDDVLGHFNWKNCPSFPAINTIPNTYYIMEYSGNNPQTAYSREWYNGDLLNRAYMPYILNEDGTSDYFDYYVAWDPVKNASDNIFEFKIKFFTCETDATDFKTAKEADAAVTSLCYSDNSTITCPKDAGVTTENSSNQTLENLLSRGTVEPLENCDCHGWHNTSNNTCNACDNTDAEFPSDGTPGICTCLISGWTVNQTTCDCDGETVGTACEPCSGTGTSNNKGVCSCPGGGAYTHGTGCPA